jgi:hypothetical protein
VFLRESIAANSRQGKFLFQLGQYNTGAGSGTSSFQLVLDEDDCLNCGGFSASTVTVGAAYAGRFPIYDLFV